MDCHYSVSLFFRTSSQAVQSAYHASLILNKFFIIVFELQAQIYFEVFSLLPTLAPKVRGSLDVAVQFRVKDARMHNTQALKLLPSKSGTKVPTFDVQFWNKNVRQTHDTLRKKYPGTATRKMCGLVPGFPHTLFCWSLLQVRWGSCRRRAPRTTLTG